MKQAAYKKYSNSGNPHVLEAIPSDAVHILDVGCGAGDNARILREQGKQVTGITISEEEAITAQSHLKKIFIHNLEQGLPHIEDRFDVVICAHVLEHIAYPEKLLEDIKGVLKEKGKLIVALPNIMHYRPRLRLLLGKFEYEKSGVWDYTHLRWYTFQSAQHLLIQHGYVIEQSWVTGGLPFDRVFRKYLPAAGHRLAFKALSRLSKSLFGSQLMYIAKVNE